MTTTFIKVTIDDDGNSTIEDATAEITEAIRVRNETSQYLAAIIGRSDHEHVHFARDFDYRPDRHVLFGARDSDIDTGFEVYVSSVDEPE